MTPYEALTLEAQWHLEFQSLLAKLSKEAPIGEYALWRAYCAGRWAERNLESAPETALENTK